MDKLGISLLQISCITHRPKFSVDRP